MRDILVLCPQERDVTAVRSAGLEDRYRIRFEGSDLDQLEEFDPGAFLAGLADIGCSNRGWAGTKASVCSPPSPPPG